MIGISEIQGRFAVASGTDTYACTYNPAITEYETGRSYLVQFTNGNTGASTLDLNGLGPQAIVNANGSALTGGEIAANQIVELVYTGTNFKIVGSTSSGGSPAIPYGVTDAATQPNYTVSTTPTTFAYSTGKSWIIQFAETNTGTVTLNIDGVGGLGITKNGSDTLGPGDIEANQAYMVVYNGANFQLVGKITKDIFYFATSGTDTYTGSTPLVLAAYTAGDSYIVKFSTANTGPCTLNINGLGAAGLLKNVGDALVAGDILTGQVYLVVYDGANFQIEGKIASATSPAGLDSEVQYNNGGSFGAQGNFTFDDATGIVYAANFNPGNLTASELVATDVSKNLQSLAVATYPSLAELAFVKGVTSAIQTQLNGKEPTITPGALTRTDDTNVTVTLGGTPATALLQAVSLTMGWSGLLSLARGGTNKNLTAVNGGVCWTDADSIEVTAAGVSGQYLKSNGAAAPSWDTPTDSFITGNNHNQLQVPSGATDYFPGFPSNAGLTTTESARAVGSPASFTASNLSLTTSAAQPGTGSLVVTYRVALANTALTITIAAGSAAGVYRDGVNTAAVAVDDLVSVSITNNAATSGATMVGHTWLGTR